MSAKSKVPKCPVKGWRWAHGLKPCKDDRFLWSSGLTTVVEKTTLTAYVDGYPEGFDVSVVGGPHGYIRRIPTRRKSK